MAAAKLLLLFTAGYAERHRVFCLHSLLRLFILQSYINARSSALFLGYETVTIFLPKHI